MFIIEIEGPTQTNFVSSGEYTRFSLTPNLSGAKIFQTIDDVREALKDPEFTRRNVFSDGSSSPPSLIWNGLDICFKRPTASGFINIRKLEITTVESIYIKDGLKNV